MSTQVITLNLKLPAQRLAQIMTAIGVLQGYVSDPDVAYVLAHWQELPEDVQQKVRTQASTFGRLLDLAQRFP